MRASGQDDGGQPIDQGAEVERLALKSDPSNSPVQTSRFSSILTEPDGLVGSESTGVTRLSGLLWRLAAVLAIALFVCVVVVRKYLPTQRVRGTADSGKLSLDATLPLSNRSTVNLVSAAGHSVVVVSDTSGVKSVVTLPARFEDSLSDPSEPNEAHYV